ncbi:MAG TPA: tRNA 2-thiouridine(34) synthase MnmA [Thermodesulfobacteriaceae bacterium]|nr:tRNA 2-thiouridine(34) synthase MnmA [Thermodesulfobacteriaceae bacterium]
MEPRRKGKKKSVLVALSGGVDSAVAAFDLVKAGWHVEACHLDLMSGNPAESCLDSCRETADFLGIRLHVLHETEKFQKNIISYFIKTYEQGLTPNPCVICNRNIKIALCLEFADQLELEYLATGHYAMTRMVDGGPAGLFRAADSSKDQSYFLHRIPLECLPRLVFPLGSQTKEEVKKKAAEAGLAPLVQRESQELCFLRGDYRRYLAGLPEFRSKPGEMITTDGVRAGIHSGLHRYTIGQRRGLGVPDRTPFYVVAMDIRKNRLIIGKKKDLLKTDLIIEDMNWLAPVEQVKSGQYTVKIRSRHMAVPASIRILSHAKLRICFDDPQKAVTPGQFAVLYSEDRVIGGGVICG